MAAIYDALGNYQGDDGTSAQPALAQPAPPPVAPGSRTPNNKPATSTDPGAVPPKADAAPAATQFLGLCAALNQHQQQLVKSGVQKIADVYAVEFAPAALASASLIKQGTTDHRKTDAPAPKTAAQSVDPATNKLNTNSYTVQVVAGQQIAQLIEQIVRGSTYMTDQANQLIDPVTQKPIPNPNSNGQTTWYKVSMRSEPLGYDTSRNNYAYKMTYIVAPYGINQAQSQYFTSPKFRGLHKSYNYWFTGQNNAILNFEQNFNALYRQIINGTATTINKEQNSDPRIKVAKTYQTASEQSSQGADGKTNEPVANLADALLSPGDQGSIKLRILGDPGWMPGGEMSTGIDAINYQFSPFLADGGINFDASEVAFGVSWNRPADYNMSTGLMDVTKNNVTVNGLQGSQPQDSYTYKATTVKCTFSKGRFEQELEGLLMPIPLPENTISPNGRDSLFGNLSDLASRNAQMAKDGLAAASTPVAGGDGTWDGENTGPATPADDGQNDTTASPQPAPPPEPPTSNGDITYQNTLTASVQAGDITVEQAQQLGLDTSNGEPQVMAPPDDAFYR